MGNKQKLTAQELVSSLLVKAAPVEVELGSLGKTVTISKFKLKHIPIVLKVFDLIKGDIDAERKAMDAEFARLKQAEDSEGLEAFASGATSTDGILVKLISKHMTSLVELIAICSSLPTDEVDELDLDEATAIVTGVILLNQDFFMEKVMPTILNLMGSVPALMQQNQKST